MHLDEIQAEVDDWVQANGGYWSELSMFARLAEETGELGRELNVEYGDRPAEPTAIDDEAADVLFTLVALCNRLDIDLESAFRNSMDELDS